MSFLTPIKPIETSKRMRTAKVKVKAKEKNAEEEEAEAEEAPEEAVAEAEVEKPNNKLAANFNAIRPSLTY
jgi:hypothetical protein